MPDLRIPFHRDVPREWELQLAEVSPPTNRFSYLKLIWEPGYPWDVCERYMLYQMLPARLMSSEFHQGLLEQLQRPTPPQGYYDHTLGRYIEEENCAITTRAWHLFRETGCWGSPWWVIQGEHGGHKRWFTEGEKKALRFMGLPATPPEPGDLPYAPFDERVLAKIAEHDVLKGLDSGLSRERALLAGGHSARHEAQDKAMRARLAAWLREQVDEIAPELVSAMDGVGAARGTMSREEQIELEQASELAEENWIERGQTNGGKRYLHL